MTGQLPNMPLSTEINLDSKVRVPPPINISAFSARQRVTQYVMLELSTQLGADAPELKVGERSIWSVPVVFTLPGKGALGRVTGVIVEDAAQYAKIQDIHNADGPMVFLYESPYPVALSKKVKGFIQIPLGNNIFRATSLTK